MPHITSIQRLGRQEGRQEDILEALEVWFGKRPGDLRQKIRTVHDEEALRRLFREALTAPSLDAFRNALK